MQTNIEFTNEQLEILHTAIELITRVWNAVKELVIRAYENLKEFLSRKASIKTKSYKKGKKYVHKYIHIKLWKLLERGKI